jgi:diguanylate cyclase (GGDEF)-like protein
MKILVADDDPVSRRLTEAALRSVGHEVVTVRDGREAWEALGQGGYDIAVLDWMMPEMDGVALCRRFHRQVADDYLYIILLTSKARQEDIVQGLDAGADEYLVKPFEPRELQARVRAAARIVNLERRLLSANARLGVLASTDELTGAKNRRALLKEIAEQAAYSLQQHWPLSIMMMDIDRFKQINDTRGHGVGDLVLQEFHRRVAASLRPSDSVGRLGGDEFLAVLPRTAEQEGLAVGEQVVAAVAAAPFAAPAGEPLEVTTSAGLAEVTPVERVERMLSLADQALYEAKRGGGNRVCATEADPRRVPQA